MTRRRVLVLCAGLGLAARASLAAELRIGGSLGFGLTASERNGRFEWDWNSAREETSLVHLKVGFSPVPALVTFVAFGARLDASQSDDVPRFELREAALRYATRPTERESLVVGVFARQPAALWLDHGLVRPLEPFVLGDDVQGARGDLGWRRLLATFIAADASSLGPAAEDINPRDDDVLVARLRGDWREWGTARLGGTFVRHLPSGAPTRGDPASVDALHRDLAGVDLRLVVRGVQLQVDYSQVDPDYEEPGAEALQEPGLRSGWDLHGTTRLTDIMPTTAALVAEARASALGNERWGWWGFAPAYRAVGRNHSNRLLPPASTPGSPVRGFEGYRLEAWYRLAAWPLWLRQVYDRHVQFRDAQRRVIAQASEVEGALAAGVGARLRYTQTQVHEEITARDEHHGALLAELRGAWRDTRFRGQLALQDLDSPARRDVLVVEAGARVSTRVQAVARASCAREPTGLRRAFFVELQYWHLPQFEVGLQYGPEWAGDTADPALDPDLLAAGDMRGVVRLHFRGWF